MGRIDASKVPSQRPQSGGQEEHSTLDWEHHHPTRRHAKDVLSTSGTGVTDSMRAARTMNADQDRGMSNRLRNCPSLV